MTDDEFDKAQDDFEREHRYAQAALQRKRVAIPDGLIMRYEYVYDQSEDLMCDKVWINRLTGKEVMRYDAADPANTNSYYVALPDEDSFIRRGMDIYAVIDAKEAKMTPALAILRVQNGPRASSVRIARKKANLSALPHAPACWPAAPAASKRR